jgi:hypothetical protein
MRHSRLGKRKRKRRRLSAEEPPGRAQLAASAIQFANENAALAPVFPPAHGARSIGQVIIANLRKNSANLCAGT